ncbi:MAG: PHP domain-containing protein, partial [Clostridia bacterium]|nr:PHP domain-containing protein [Clostridia bacterium]
MKVYLLPESGRFYKANLHCHSDLSDGALPPAEIKRRYMEHGYSIVAFTDHDVLLPHTDLASEDFLPL